VSWIGQRKVELEKRVSDDETFEICGHRRMVCKRRQGNRTSARSLVQSIFVMARKRSATREEKSATKERRKSSRDDAHTQRKNRENQAVLL